MECKMHQLHADLKCMVMGRINAPFYADRECNAPCCAQLQIPSSTIVSAKSPAPDGFWRDPPLSAARSFADNLLIPGAWLLQDQILFFEVRFLMINISRACS